MVLCTQEFADYVNKGCPLVLGGPLPHAMAAKAVAFQEASSREFEVYASKVIKNAAVLAECCMGEGLNVVTGGTDNHLLLLDVSSFGLTGRQSESAVREASITLNRNTLPFDMNGPWYTSGLRVGTPALTSLGMGGSEMKEIASTLKLILSNTHPSQITKGKNSGSLSKARYRIETEALGEARSTVSQLLGKFPVYPELDLGYLQKSFSQS